MISKLKFLLRYTHKFRWWYTGGIIFLGLTVWISVSIPEYLQKSIDLISAGRDGNENEFYRYVIIILILAIVLILVRTFSRTLFFIPGRLIERKIKGEMFNKLTSFGKEYFDKNETGSIISRINNDINGVRMITGFGMMQSFNILLSLSLTPYKMWVLSPELTLYCILPLIIIFTVVRFGMVMMVKNMRLRITMLQKLSGNIVSYLSGISVIKSFNMYNWSENNVHEDNISLFNFTLKIAWVRSFILPLLVNLEQILKIVVLFVGGLFVIQGKFTIGELTAFIAYTALLAMPIMGLGWVLTVFQQGFVGIASIQTIMDRKGIDDELEDLSNSKISSLFNKGIRIENLTYKYHDADKPVLKKITFKIKPGDIVGLAGKVGSGKTTLVNCLNRYLKVDKGQLFFNNTDASTVKGRNIRTGIRTVSQDVFLFSDSIENNILFGSGRDKENKKLQEVVFQSSLSDELERFINKEKTIVGEKGIMLSGGQKQRISLARALFTPCELLILDDVFSAVDNETERFLVKQIFNSHSANSLLIVSNRISVLEKTDYIIVLENGEITDIGNHASLISKPGFYYETWELQKNSDEDIDNVSLNFN